MYKFGRRNLHNPEEIIAVGDIHGEVNKLEGLLEKIWKFLDNPNCHLVFCGDYFDRGINSPRVFEVLCEIRDKKPDQVFFIEGNHEEMLWETLVNKESWWLDFTKKTLDQMVAYWNIPYNPELAEENYYGPFSNFDWLFKKDIEVVRKVCDAKGFIKFLEDLIPYYESDKVICTHAPLSRLSCDGYFKNGGKNEDLLSFLNLKWTFIPEKKPQLIIPKVDKFLICGHQCPRGKNNVSPRIFNKRAFIDTGCGLHPERPLTAFKWPNRTVFQEF